jgi:hypothetical protein
VGWRIYTGTGKAAVVLGLAVGIAGTIHGFVIHYHKFLDHPEIDYSMSCMVQHSSKRAHTCTTIWPDGSHQTRVNTNAESDKLDEYAQWYEEHKDVK